MDNHVHTPAKHNSDTEAGSTPEPTPLNIRLSNQAQPSLSGSDTDTDNPPPPVPMHDQQQSPLFLLPAELRIQIWEAVLTPVDDANDTEPVSTGLLLTCRRAYAETHVLLYQLNAVRIRLFKYPSKGDGAWAARLSPAQRAAAHLHFFVDPGRRDWTAHNLLWWTRAGPLHPRRVRLTLWFTARDSCWRPQVSPVVGAVSNMHGLRELALEIRTQPNRLDALRKEIVELQRMKIPVDGEEDVLVSDPEKLEVGTGDPIPHYNGAGRSEWRSWYAPGADISHLGRRCDLGNDRLLSVTVRWHLKE